MKEFLSAKQIAELKADHRAERESRTELLQRLGFSYKKPYAVPGKANGEAQLKFISIFSELKGSKSKKDPILFVDSTHPQHNSHPASGWLPRGENNAENTIKFFKKIEAKHPDSKVIYLILDNAGYYKGKKLQEFLKTSKLELLYLPRYAPNLNLIERVWKFFKKKVLANAYYESFLEFRQSCLHFFKKRVWRSYRAELETLLTDKFQILSAA